VPIDALLVLAGGAYAVEVDHNGSRRQVAVQTGLFAEGMVEITAKASRRARCRGPGEVSGEVVVLENVCKTYR